MEIRLDIVGKILAGDEAGRYVKVVDDRAASGGFLILTAATPDMRDGYDNWVENAGLLQRYFAESHWVVEWVVDWPPRP